MISLHSSADELRDLAFAADGEQMVELHEQCFDRAFAHALALALRDSPPDKRAQAEQWLEVIGDLHPSLRQEIEQKDEVE